MKLSLPIVCLSAAALLGLASADKLPAAGFGNGFARQVEDDTLSGPYAPSGWTPDGPQLQLPTREYGAPVEQQPDEDGSAVEVSEETILFAGQSVTSEQLPEEPTTTTVSSRYLPPASPEDVSDDDGQEPNVLRVQGLPLAPASEFNGQLRQQLRFKPQQQQQQIRFGQQQLQQQKQVRFNQQIRVQQQQQQQRIVYQPTAARIVVTPSFVPTQPRLTLPAVQVSAPFRKHKKPHLVAQQQFGQLQQQQQQQQQFAQQQQVYGPPAAEPQLVYGPPQNVYGPPATTPVPQPELQTADNEENSEVEEEDNETDAEQVEDDAVNGPAVSVANAFDTNSGQYYILGEDNRLQRVVYMTSQSAKDRRQNGFTAKLQYAPVEPIRDPIYAYDAAGQLVRVYNRK